MSSTETFTKTFTEQRCKCCGLLFQPVTWQAWRVAGYCSEKCQPIPYAKAPAQR